MTAHQYIITKGQVIGVARPPKQTSITLADEDNMENNNPMGMTGMPNMSGMSGMPEMMDSNALPPEAMDYINSLNEQAPQTNTAEIENAKAELHTWAKSFIDKSKSWRAASYETKWRLYQSNVDSKMEDSISKAKEPWQSKAFVPITASHKETIQSHIFKVIAGVQPPLEVSARFELGDIDQSDNIRDIIIREMDKTRWGVEFNKVLDDSLTYGSGFCRLSFEVTRAKRKLRVAIKEGFSDNVDGLDPRGLAGYALRAARGNLKVVGYQDNEEDVIVYRGLRMQHYSIWDIFPDPKALKVSGSDIAYRFKKTYGDLVNGARQGFYFPEIVEKLRGVNKVDKYQQGQAEVLSDREVSDASITKTDYGVVHECYELFCKLPQKWIYTITGTQITDPEELVSARVLFTDLCPIAVEINNEYDQEPPILKLDYLPKNNEFYGIGVPQMLLDPQRVINEVVNQRLDNGSIALNNTFGVNEKALINPAQDLKSKPGMMVRLDGNKCPNGDIRNAIMEMPINDTALRAGFSEVNEAERWAQERTSSNRVTMGTAGLVKDMNQTLGGQQILQQSAGDKFSFIGLLMELDFLQSFYHQAWKTIYPNLTPEDITDSIGEERAQKFILLTPEEIQRDYIYTARGVYTMGSKFKTLAAVQAIREQFKGAPWINDEKFFDKECQINDLNPEEFKLDETQILQQQAEMIQPGGEMGGGGGGFPTVDTVGQPMGPDNMPTGMGR